MDKIISTIRSAFMANRWTWTIDGEPKEPTRDDIKDLLEQALSALEGTDSPAASIEIGRLIVKKDADHRDVYLWIGDLTDDQN